jgi:YesN/AraC family two-component response regulator
MGFEVSAVLSNGREAIEYVLAHAPDVILTDIRMPDVSGLDIAEFVASSDTSTLVVFLSAHRDFEYARLAIRHNVIDYLVKPVSIDAVKELFSRIHTRLENERRLAIQDEVQRGESERLIIRQAKAYIVDHMTEEISLAKLSEEFELSPVYFSRLFKQETGANYVDFLVQTRIEKAKELLSDPTKRIYEVSHAVGYQNEKYFSRVFRNHVGRTPSEFREETATGRT